MKEIVILSGKGGVGKSTITASLGSIFSEKYKIVIADTDVDTPNLALFFNAKERNSENIASCEKAFIDYNKCKGCMRCVRVCKFSAMASYKDKPIVILYSCEGCGACIVVCPENAISIKKVINGKVDISDIEEKNCVIVAGELNIGGSSSGHLVDIVKKKAREEADKTKADLILIDGPPGIGCPVISSIKGSDYVIAVTEPTPAALHDLKRLYKVVGYFRIPIAIVINKSDIASSEKIKEFAKKNDIIILAEIPYDRKVSEAVAMAMPVVKAYPNSEVSINIKKLSERLNIFEFEKEQN